MITADMKAVIEATHLCFAATVTPDGRPNLSPKGTIRVWDDEHLFFLDIASPNTRANLARTPWMEINVVEQLSRRGYRFFGRAEVHLEGGVRASHGACLWWRGAHLSGECRDSDRGGTDCAAVVAGVLAGGG